MLSFRDLEISLEVTDRLLSTFGDKVEKVVLFGSRARGDSNDESDYDFLVIGDLGYSSAVENMKACNLAIADFSLEYDVLVYSKKGYEENCLLKSAIDEEGVVLFDRGYSTRNI